MRWSFVGGETKPEKLTWCENIGKETLEITVTLSKLYLSMFTFGVFIPTEPLHSYVTVRCVSHHDPVAQLPNVHHQTPTVTI